MIAPSRLSAPETAQNRCSGKWEQNPFTYISGRFRNKSFSSPFISISILVTLHDTSARHRPIGPSKPLLSKSDSCRNRITILPQHHGQQGSVETSSPGCHPEARCLVCDCPLQLIFICLCSSLYVTALVEG